MLGLRLELGETDADGDTDADAETEGDRLADADTEGLRDADGDVEAEADTDGEIEAEGDVDAEAPGLVTSLRSDPSNFVSISVAGKLPSAASAVQANVSRRTVPTSTADWTIVPAIGYASSVT